MTRSDSKIPLGMSFEWLFETPQAMEYFQVEEEDVHSPCFLECDSAVSEWCRLMM
jgi:hypothetical protein